MELSPIPVATPHPGQCPACTVPMQAYFSGIFCCLQTSAASLLGVPARPCSRLSLSAQSKPSARTTHVVICVSMKIRMKTKMAGSSRLATIIHTGKALFSPGGWMTQPRFSGAVTEKPLGTLSFCRAEGGAGAGEPPWGRGVP